VDYKSKECPMCGVQEAADRVGQSWDVVESPLASESEPEGRVEANTTPISKPLMISQSKTTTKSSPLKVGLVQYATAEQVNDTSQWIITIRMETFEGFSVQDVIQAWLDSWTRSNYSVEQSVT